MTRFERRRRHGPRQRLEPDGRTCPYFPFLLLVASILFQLQPVSAAVFAVRQPPAGGRSTRTILAVAESQQR
jgi:hypothetical protein